MNRNGDPTCSSSLHTLKREKQQPASFVDHHKYVSNKRSYHELCRISNRICHENGLATSMPTVEKVKAIKRTWNIIVAPVGKPSYVSQLIRQSGLPSTMRNPLLFQRCFEHLFSYYRIGRHLYVKDFFQCFLLVFRNF